MPATPPRRLVIRQPVRNLRQRIVPRKIHFQRRYRDSAPLDGVKIRALARVRAARRRGAAARAADRGAAAGPDTAATGPTYEFSWRLSVSLSALA